MSSISGNLPRPRLDLNMVKKRQLAPKSIYSESHLIEFLAQHEIKPVHLKTVQQYLSRHYLSIATLVELPQFPLRALTALTSEFTHLTSRVQECQTSVDDGTIKLLIELQDGHFVESVIMRHTDRLTLCVSSQIGCAMKCSFCATGTLGNIGNLSSGEILEQVVHANRVLASLSSQEDPQEGPVPKIRNVVFMGQGEPLNNYVAVVEAIQNLTRIFHIAPKHITLSTVGVIPRMKDLQRDAPWVRLALSLHAPTQALRQQIVPTSRAYPLDKLMDVMDAHLAQVSKKDLVFIEYVMLENVNDSTENAHELGVLLRDKRVHVNLIPYNPTEVGMDYTCSKTHDIATFHQILRREYGLKATIRLNHGQDIDGACGQLAVKTMSHKKNEDDIEDWGKSRTSKKKSLTKVVDHHPSWFQEHPAAVMAVALVLCVSARALFHKIK